MTRTATVTGALVSRAAAPVTAARTARATSKGWCPGATASCTLDVPAGRIVLLLHPDRVTSQRSSEASDARNGRHDAVQLPNGPRTGSVPVRVEFRAGADSDGDLVVFSAVRDPTSVSVLSWRSVTRRSTATVIRPSRSAATLSSVLLNWSAAWCSGCATDAVKAASILSGPGGSALTGGRTAGSDTGSCGAGPMRTLSNHAGNRSGRTPEGQEGRLLRDPCPVIGPSEREQSTQVELTAYCLHPLLGIHLSTLSQVRCSSCPCARHVLSGSRQRSLVIAGPPDSWSLLLLKRH